MSRASWIWLGLAGGIFAVLIGGGAWWFYSTHEQVEEDTTTPATGLAVVNPYHAGDLLLDRLGVPTESRFELGVLPPPTTTLVILTQDLEARRQMVTRLTPWVTSGGRLVVIAPLPQSRPGGDAPPPPDPQRDTPLLFMAGIRLEPTQEPPTGIVPPGLDPLQGGLGGLFGALFSPELHREVVTVELPLTRQVLQASLDVTRTLTRTAPATLDDNLGGGLGDGSQLKPYEPILRVPLGQGWVTGVLDGEFATNDSIAEHDHARLLAALVELGGRPQGAVFVVRARAESLFGLLWREGWMVMISLATLILAWVWLASRRFGPTLPDPERSRRSLLEHVEAVGQLLWRKGRQEVLIESTRRAVRHKLAARLAGETDLEGRALAQALSDETGLRASLVHDAFYGQQPQDKRAFTKAISELQELWRTR